MEIYSGGPSSNSGYSYRELKRMQERMVKNMRKLPKILKMSEQYHSKQEQEAEKLLEKRLMEEELKDISNELNIKKQEWQDENTNLVKKIFQKIKKILKLIKDFIYKKIKNAKGR